MTLALVEVKWQSFCFPGEKELNFVRIACDNFLDFYFLSPSLYQVKVKRALKRLIIHSVFFLAIKRQGSSPEFLYTVDILFL